MKLSDVYKLLDEAVKEGKVLRWSTEQDIGSKVVLRVAFINGDVVRERNVVLYIKDRGLSTEEAYWVNSRPPELFQPEKTTSWFDEKKDTAFGQIKGLVKVVNTTVTGDYATITTYVDNGDGTVSQKSYLAYLDADGNLVVKEIV